MPRRAACAVYSSPPDLGASPGPGNTYPDSYYLAYLINTDGTLSAATPTFFAGCMIGGFDVDPVSGDFLYSCDEYKLGAGQQRNALVSSSPIVRSDLGVSVCAKPAGLRRAVVKCRGDESADACAAPDAVGIILEV